ncbi:MAG: ankyrin repeat domain-containing protein [Planctomycetes bacterium]|nr:ankyrin repeat domain-containing protein [Planctomycetota bacterium]
MMIRPEFPLQTALFTGVVLLAATAGAVAEEPLDALFAATRSGDVEKIKTLVTTSPTLVNEKNRYGDTPLFAAVENMKLEAAKTLLGAGASIQGTFRRDWQMLHAVAFFGEPGEITPKRRKAMAALLIEHGADPSAANEDGTTPLHMAVMKARMELLVLFVISKANINAKDARESTPLHYAARFGHPEVIVWLVKHGAKPNLPDRLGNTPLHDAVTRFKKEAAFALIKAGADTNARNDLRRTPLHLTAINGRQIDEVDALMAEVADVMLANGADRHAWDDANWTTMKYAKKNGRVQVIAVLESYASR